MATRKTPMRMCVGCREMKPKAELIRIVKTPQETILFDNTGKLSGRGAYICRNAACLEKAQKIKAFDRSFSISVSKEVYESLRKELENIEK
ncbi:MAG: YlxR family protein [Clostridia bacterium]|nr:YlxR family protein [Clostridia bacterium]